MGLGRWLSGQSACRASMGTGVLKAGVVAYCRAETGRSLGLSGQPV